MKFLNLTSFLFCLTLLPVFGGSAKERALEYFTVLKAGEYDRTASFFSPQALGDFREMMSFLDEIPEEAAGQVFGVFFGEEATKETVKEMSNDEFFGSFITFTLKQAEATGNLSFDKIEVLGEVVEGDVVHVLTRNKVTVGEIEVEAMEVMSFEKVEGEWMALLQGSMKGMAAQMRASLGQ